MLSMVGCGCGGASSKDAEKKDNGLLNLEAWPRAPKLKKKRGRRRGKQRGRKSGRPSPPAPKPSGSSKNCVPLPPTNQCPMGYFRKGRQCCEGDLRAETFNAPYNSKKNLKECFIARTESGWAMSSNGKTATANNKKEAKRWCSANCGAPGTCVNRYVFQLPSQTFNARGIAHKAARQVMKKRKKKSKKWWQLWRADDGEPEEMSFWDWLRTPPQQKEEPKPQENKDFPIALREDLEMNKEREQRTKFAKASKIGNVHMAEDTPIHYDAHTSAPPLPDQYPYVYDPVNDYLPRYRYPAGTSWGMGYNPADPYRPLDYQSVTTHQDPRTKAEGGV